MPTYHASQFPGLGAKIHNGRAPSALAPRQGNQLIGDFNAETRRPVARTKATATGPSTRGPPPQEYKFKIVNRPDGADPAVLGAAPIPVPTMSPAPTPTATASSSMFRPDAAPDWPDDFLFTRPDLILYQVHVGSFRLQRQRARRLHSVGSTRRHFPYSQKADYSRLGSTPSPRSRTSKIPRCRGWLRPGRFLRPEGLRQTQDLRRS
jgi:hypothetical protein